MFPQSVPTFPPVRKGQGRCVPTFPSVRKCQGRCVPMFPHVRKCQGKGKTGQNRLFSLIIDYFYP